MNRKQALKIINVYLDKMSQGGLIANRNIFAECIADNLGFKEDDLKVEEGSWLPMEQAEGIQGAIRIIDADGAVYNNAIWYEDCGWVYLYKDKYIEKITARAIHKPIGWKRK